MSWSCRAPVRMESDIFKQQHSGKVSVIMKRMIYTVFWGLLSVTGSHSAWAVINCTPLPGIPRTDTVTLAPANISAGMDIPDGTVIYQGEWSTISSGTPLNVISCTSTAPSSSQFFMRKCILVYRILLCHCRGGCTHSMATWSIKPVFQASG